MLHAERGQGTVEYVGIVLAVAALLVAVAAAIDNKVGGPIATALVHRLQDAVDTGRQRQARVTPSAPGRASGASRQPGALLLGDELGPLLRDAAATPAPRSAVAGAARQRQARA